MESTPITYHSRPGRPVGSAIFNYASFLRHSVEAYRKFLSKLEKHPSQHDVAAELLIARSTLNRYFNSFGITWAEIRQIAMKKWLEEESI